MTNFRAKKTSKNADDFKVLMAGIVCAIGLLVISNVLPRLTEYRWYRDMTQITPFHSVVLLYSNVQDYNTLVVIGGSMTKRRCEYKGLYGYILGDDGIRYRVSVDTTVEDQSGAVGNRPPSHYPENWGPWSISTKSNPNFPMDVIPVSFEIIAEHVNCPTEPKTQRNVFVEGTWTNYILPTEPSMEILQKTVTGE